MLSNVLEYWPRTYILVGCMAFMIAAFSMPLGIRIFCMLGMMDPVSENKIHTKPVPRGGGIVIFIAFAVAVLFPGYRSDGMNGILIGAFVCLVVGALDDYIGGIPGFYKLITLVAATLILSQFDVRINLFQNAFLDVAATILWIVGVTSAFNGTDNMDGLASGLAVIVAGMFFAIAVQTYVEVGGETSLSWFGMLAVGLMGANLGFLIFNSKPARVFMGDSGSFFLGFTLAALGVMGEWTENRIIAATIPVLILGVPLFDFAYIIIARIVKGETRTFRSVIDHCAPDHVSHRLVWFGFTQRQAVLFIYLISITLGISGILLRNTTDVLDSQLALFQGVAIVAIIVILMSQSGRRYAATLKAHEATVDGLAAQIQDRGAEGERVVSNIIWLAYKRLHEELGDGLTINDAGLGSRDVAVIHEHLASLLGLPTGLLTKLRTHGLSGIRIGHGGVAKFPGYETYSGVSVPDGPSGVTWDVVRGAYFSTRKEIILGTGSHGYGGTALHEVGHALGDLLAYNHSPVLNQEYEIRAKSPLGRVNAYYPGGRLTERGKKEFFAESVSLGIMSEEALETNFSREYVQFIRVEVLGL